MKSTIRICFFAGIVSLSIGWYYCFYNTSGHSAVDPLFGSILFVPLFLVGIFHIAASKGRELFSWLLSVVGFSGIVFGVFVHITAILQEYSYWVEAGLSTKNPNSNLLLLSYASVVVSLLFGILIISHVKAKKQLQHPDLAN